MLIVIIKFFIFLIKVEEYLVLEELILLIEVEAYLILLLIGKTILTRYEHYEYKQEAEDDPHHLYYPCAYATEKDLCRSRAHAMR